MKCEKCQMENLKNTRYCFQCDAELPMEIEISIPRKIVNHNANKWVDTQDFVFS